MNNLIKLKQLEQSELYNLITGTVNDSYLSSGIDFDYISQQILNYFNSSGDLGSFIVNTTGTQYITGDKHFVSMAFGIPGTGSGFITYSQLTGSGFVPYSQLNLSGFIASGQTGQFYPSATNPSGFLTISTINSSGFATRSSIDSSGFMTLTGINVSGFATKALLDSSGFINSLLSVTGIKATGSNSVTGTVSFTGLGGTQIVLVGNEIRISGASAGVSNGITGLGANNSSFLTGKVSINGASGISTFITGNNILIRGPLVESVFFDANADSYTFTTDFNNYRYKMICNFVNNAGQIKRYGLFINSESDNGKYIRQKITASGGSLLLENGNDSLFCVVDAQHTEGEEVGGVAIVDMTRGIASDLVSSGYFNYNSRNNVTWYYNNVVSGFYTEEYHGASNFRTANITSLTVSGIGHQIDSRTKLSLYRIPL